MIVVEGPDGAGKSTLVRWICEEFALKEGQRTTQNRDEIYKTTRRDTWDAVHYELMCEGPPLVWDRLGPFSEPIYAMLMDRPVAFTATEVGIAKAVLRALKCPVILCRPAYEVVRANVDKSHQIEVVRGRLALIYKYYLDLVQLARVIPDQTFVVYDYTAPTNKYSQVITAIDDYLRNRKERECFSSSTPAPSV